MEMAGFPFYMENPLKRGDSNTYPIREGNLVFAEGTLLPNYYIWVGYLDSYANHPDLFFNLGVTGTLKVEIPERFVNRYSGGKNLSTHLEPAHMTIAM
jgi:hypothetical protein